jgi:Rrf2 family protein
MTQLPVTSAAIAKADGMPAGYLAKVMQQLVRAGFVRSVRGRNRGYVFTKDPETISLLRLFEAIEGGPLFDDCPLKHCACGGTRENCTIFSRWISATAELKDLLEQTSVASAAWSHPEHRFSVLPSFTEGETPKPV